MRKRILVAVSAATCLLLPGAAVAHATTNKAAPVRLAHYSDGASLRSNLWITSIADGGGCGKFASSAIINKKPNWIKNVTNFHANGVGATLGGGTVGGSGADASVSAVNNNGVLGAYLSGTVCANWLTWYTSAGITGSALHFGQIRIAATGV